MKLSVKKTIPFIGMAVMVMAGAVTWIVNGRGAEEPFVLDAGGEISLSDEEAASLEIALDEVKSQPIWNTVHVIGKVVFDQDAKSYITPIFSGNVESVAVKKGDMVKKGDILAAIFSQEAAACKVEYQKCQSELALMKIVLDTEDALYAKGFSTEQQYLKAKQEHDQAELSRKYAFDQLQRLGILDVNDEIPLSRYYLKAPMDGTIVENTLTVGAMANPHEDSILMADLDRVHIEIGLNEEELSQIQPGSFIEIGEHTGIVKTILPSIDSKTQKSYALAHLVDGFKLTPGSLVDVKVIVDMQEAPLAVKRSAVVEADGENLVFVKTDEGFMPTPVELGNGDDDYVEIVSNNLDLGDLVADDNLFILKSEYSKEGED